MNATGRDLEPEAVGGTVASQGKAMEKSRTSAVDTPGAPGISLPARRIPIPTTISVEAQAVLAWPSPGAAALEPDPEDSAGWEKFIDEGNAAFSQMLASQMAASQPTELIEHRLSSATLYEIVPATLSAERGNNALLYVHGGAFILGGGMSAAYFAYELARISGLRTFSIDYRMPPQSPYPAALNDVLEGYRFIISKFAVLNVAIYGPSAGGGLAASCLLKARDLGLPLPAACVLHSPEADLTESGDSFETNLGIDPVLKRLTKSIALYADGNDLKDPYLSPLFGDFTKGFPPTMLSAGTRDLFLSNTVLMHRALRRAGVPADLSIWEAMGHVGFFGAAPEDREILEEQAQFILDHFTKG
ncbi:Acetyl esterase/lipase [Novosphingobium sp. CF614]|uniref:alpha/beta hydrolase n=1 Tax=Novosphingobium sp. CF614 TaxID=1884364 RepID=UPI0008E56841|nr:alpha/beta hydrolase [Novosphingobium sp. CF614]SFG47031.1 Acetyl esterase/lipase [Novosphingobium sp. CF614]